MTSVLSQLTEDLELQGPDRAITSTIDAVVQSQLCDRGAGGITPESVSVLDWADGVSHPRRGPTDPRPYAQAAPHRTQLRSEPAPPPPRRIPQVDRQLPSIARGQSAATRLTSAT